MDFPYVHDESGKPVDIFEAEIVEKAFAKTLEIYKDKRRKINDLPYITHLQAVLMILRNQSPDIMAACLLAKTLDDKFYDFKQLTADFSLQIAQLVKEMSEGSRPTVDFKINYQTRWLARKRKFLKNFQTRTEAAKLILTAKHIHNLLSLLRDYQDQGEVVWEKLKLSKRAMWGYYQRFFNVLTANFHNAIVGDYYIVFREAKKVFGKRRATKRSAER
jgi:(p)ppGpp synthase/HD superfamily hydrolase